MISFSLILAIAACVFWWERQLPNKLRHAAREGDLEACLRFGEQLAALRWLGTGSLKEQALCRRRQAKIFWTEDNVAEALKLQRRLVQSEQEDASQQKRDRNQLDEWETEIRDQALVLFRNGKFEQAIARLTPLEGSKTPGSSALSDTLKETWNRNRLDYQRLKALIDKERWWEALDSLNRLDHPWWQQRAEKQRDRVEAAIEQLRDTEEHQQHGSTDPNVIAGAELEAAVQKELKAGTDPWDAFQSACRLLGGHVEEDGPESFCRRRSDKGS